MTDLELEVLLKTVCRELALALDLSHMTVALLNQAKTAAVVVVEYLGRSRTSTFGKTIPITGNLSYQYLLDYKVPLVVKDPQNGRHPTPIFYPMGQSGPAMLFMLPLIVAGEVVGSLNLNTVEPRCFLAEEIRLAWRVADQIAGMLTRPPLTQTHQLLITMAEQVSESVIITNTEGTILYVNPAFERVSGYSRIEVIGQNPRICNSGQQSPAFYEDLWTTISAGQVWRGRFVNKRKDGTLYTQDTTITPVRNESGALVNYIAVQREAVGEFQLAAQFHQKQKIEAIGRLAGGMAHNFNNLLTTIMGYTELALQTLPPDNSVYSDLQDIQYAAQRAANLTRQLLAFARKQVINPTVINLNTLILNNIHERLHSLIGESIELVLQLAPDLGQVKADPGQLEQVLLNLVLNARDAMPDGGKLTIKTANVILDRDGVSRYPGLTPGQYIMLTVSDTGVGMTEAVKARIFEPFFTTKEVGQGIGLGLATCFGIVKQLGGHIEIDSDVDQGTTFKIYLPRIEAAGSPVFNGKLDDLPRGTETVLVVEDDRLMRELALRILRQQGYNVLEAANSNEAWRVVRVYAEAAIHLLLIDLAMTWLGGSELVDRLKATQPDLKVLFTSGYTDNAVFYHSVLESDMACLQKPFLPAVLACKVREVLDG